MKRQPVLFIGHGSPMNVISNNAWTEKIRDCGKSFEKPRAIVVISAHWLTEGLKIHSSSHPKTIHDFRGFPQQLYQFQYQAPGQNDIAEEIKQVLSEAEITGDWGFDHGTWGVLAFLRPQADIPVIPISLNARNGSQDFYELGQRLKVFRDKNILIIGSGNLVHNLREIDFNEQAENFTWAEEFDRKVKTLTENGELKTLMDLPVIHRKTFMKAHPTSEHWAPYIVCLGAADDIGKVNWIYEGLQNGSVSMRSAKWD